MIYSIDPMANVPEVVVSSSTGEITVTATAGTASLLLFDLIGTLNIEIIPNLPKEVTIPIQLISNGPYFNPELKD